MLGSSCTHETSPTPKTSWGGPEVAPELSFLCPGAQLLHSLMASSGWPGGRPGERLQPSLWRGAQLRRAAELELALKGGIKADPQGHAHTGG
eukprot:5502483-Amphidinium_carterae.1